MQDNVPNKSVEERMKDFTMDPSRLVWADIERNLGKKKRRYIIGWWLLLPLLLGGIGLFLFVNNKKEEDHQQARHVSPGKNLPQHTRKSTVDTGATGSINSIKRNNRTSDPVETAGNLATEEKMPNSRITKIDLLRNFSTGHDTKTKRSFTTAPAGNNEANDDITASPAGIVNDKGKMTTRVESPQLSEADTSSYGSQAAEPDSLAANKMLLSKKQPAVENPDTIKNSPGKSKEEQKNPKRWQKEWTAGAGVANLEALDFFASQEILQYSNGTGGTASIRTRQQYGIRPGISAGAGIQLAKKLSSRVTFRTGIGYLYNSVNIRRTQITDSLLVSTAADLYTTLSILNFKSKLHFHHISIPLLLTWSFPKSKIDVTGGLQNHFVVAGNWKEHSSLMGKRKFYMPSVYLNPSFAFRQLNAGPYLTVGLQAFGGNKRIMEYGLTIRTPFSKK